MSGKMAIKWTGALPAPVRRVRATRCIPGDAHGSTRCERQHLGLAATAEPPLWCFQPVPRPPHVLKFDSHSPAPLIRVSCDFESQATQLDDDSVRSPEVGLCPVGDVYTTRCSAMRQCSSGMHLRRAAPTVFRSVSRCSDQRSRYNNDKELRRAAGTVEVFRSAFTRTISICNPKQVRDGLVPRAAGFARAYPPRASTANRGSRSSLPA